MPRRKREVLYLEAPRNRVWVKKFIEDQATKKGDSVAAVAFQMLAAYIIQRYGADVARQMQAAHPFKRARITKVEESDDES
jgi:hypothetical protein